MAKSNAERQREWRERNGLGGVRSAVSRLEALVAAQERRLQVLEDRGATELRLKQGAIQDLQAQIQRVVEHPDLGPKPMAHLPPDQARQLKGQELRNYVARYGPIHTDDPGETA